MSLVLLVPACSGGDDDDAGADREAETTTGSTAPPATTTTTTTLPPTTTTTRPPTPEGQITVDYLAYWAAYDQLAADPSAGGGVALDEVASGQALDSAEQSVADLRSQGERVEVGPNEAHNAYSPSLIDARTAYVADCHVADSRVIGTDGAVVRREPDGGRPETISVTLVRGPDRWLVDSLQYYDLAPGETCGPSGPTPG